MKKDTASCDIVHGSRRSEINGETIMRRSTVGNKDSEETFVRRSTVMKKDTASCDIGHGSRRSEINGETIMMRSTVGNKGSEQTFVRSSTVVNKDTASCDLGHGSRRSEINRETIMRHSTVVKTHNSAIFDVGSTKERGFQHVYKSRNTTSSCRVQVTYNLSVQNGYYPRSKQAVKRDKAKKRR